MTGTIGLYRLTLRHGPEPVKWDKPVWSAFPCIQVKAQVAFSPKAHYQQESPMHRTRIRRALSGGGQERAVA